MKLSSHLNFNGNCDEAMQFYAKTFKGTIQFKMTWGESPMCDQVGPEYQDKMMHESLMVGDVALMGADSPPGRYEKPQGMTQSISVEDLEEAKKIFDTLAEGGSVTMPFTETFWAKGFGMVTDKFSIPWMVNCEKPMQPGA